MMCLLDAFFSAFYKAGYPARKLMTTCFDTYNGSTKNKDIIKAQEKELDVIAKILEEMESDTENESDRLLNAYAVASDSEKAAMDYMLVCLCGWTMASIIEKTYKFDDDTV